MRMHPRLAAFSLLLAEVCTAAVPAAAQTVSVTIGEGLDLLPRRAARLTSVFPQQPLSRGDTLRVRSLLINLSDRAFEADADPCGLRQIGRASWRGRV